MPSAAKSRAGRKGAKTRWANFKKRSAAAKKGAAKAIRTKRKLYGKNLRRG